ncbi:hypothetical protein L226DRAFT_577099 [Lentinus tigrinus ALCF2SS1-7]|uniref:uncharacterized protein n=1 Tax=Lentinus tigrinus ALCF2SS1-7 TaxID=1328758 RepID=UPI00116607CA|nr:hypothetical protein L226DRAFT_577099 [Lentinus tigrinus ALCF2SS1-7]
MSSQSSNLPSENESQEPTPPRPKLTTIAEGELLDIPGRDPRFPKLYTVYKHPKVPQALRTFVALLDTSTQAMLDFDEFFGGMTFLEGTEEGITRMGFPAALPGDYFLIRSALGDGDPMNDHLALWSLPGRSISYGTRKSWKTLREHVGGPRSERTPQKSACIDGMWRYGTRFERHSQAINIRTSHRCYTVAQSYQTPRNLVGPTVGMKVAMGEDASDHQLLRKEIVEAAAPLAIQALEAGLTEYSAALKLQAHVTNLVPVGYEGNYAFPTFQQNITPTQRADSLALGSFKADLGNFGGKHKDENDSPGGVTCMISYGDLHPTDRPGYFIIGDLGVAICKSDCNSHVAFHSS